MSERFCLEGMRIAVGASGADEDLSIASFLRGKGASVVAGDHLRACLSNPAACSPMTLNGWVAIMAPSAPASHEPSSRQDASDTEETFAYLASVNSMLRDGASVVLVVASPSGPMHRTTRTMSSESIARGLTRQLARRVVGRRIRVNGLLLPIQSDPSTAAVTSSSPWAALQVVAGTLTYLLSNESRWITGQVIPVAGARY